jgi:hypothetical protein
MVLLGVLWGSRGVYGCGMSEGVCDMKSTVGLGWTLLAGYCGV